MKRFFLCLFVLSFLITGLSAQNPITFQVNMNVQQYLGTFNPTAGDIVVVRGSFNGWSGNLNQCLPQDTIYVCTVNFDNHYIGTTIEYKFVIVPAVGSDIWETTPNRTYTIPVGGGIIPPVYFSNQGWNIIDIEVWFRVDMQVQILNGNFDPSTDWVVVRGNQPEIGMWGGATQLFLEAGTTSIYSDWIQFDNLSIGEIIEYKFVILENGNPSLGIWEACDNRSVTVTGLEPDYLPPPFGNGYHEIMPELVYFSNITPNDVLCQDVLVNFQVNMLPAFNKLADPNAYIIDVQTGDTVYSIDEVDVAGYFNWWPWGSFAPEYWAHDDGIAPDSVEGDKIYSVGIQFYTGDPKVLVYKYGINGLDVEAGFAQNHEVTINDSFAVFTITPIDTFGSQDTLYTPWQNYAPFIVDLVPHNPPIIIPPQGGSFQYDIVIDNQSPWGFVADFWINVTLPNGSIYPILQRPNINIPHGAYIQRNNLTQTVPGGAPAGTYHYNCYVKNIVTNEIFAQDSFTFTKQ
jgi:hypothetical protein